MKDFPEMNTPARPPNTAPLRRYPPSGTGDSTAEPRLLDQMRAQIRFRHASSRTETPYVRRIKRFVLVHRKRHPREMGAARVATSLSHLALEERVASATPSQSLSALPCCSCTGRRPEQRDKGFADRSKRCSGRLPV